MLQRNREAYDIPPTLFEGPRGGKTAVGGARDRATGQVVAQVVRPGGLRQSVWERQLLRFVAYHTKPEAMVYTDGKGPNEPSLTTSGWIREGESMSGGM